MIDKKIQELIHNFQLVGLKVEIIDNSSMRIVNENGQEEIMSFDRAKELIEKFEKAIIIQEK